MNETILQRFNRGLHDLRELFHKTGRLDDSNAKLDEIVKLLCLEVASVYAPKEGIPTLKSILEGAPKNPSVVAAINSALSKVAKVDVFRNIDGESLLGPNPRLDITESEGELASQLAQLISETFNGHLHSPESAKNFEILNEAFGSFVRDNFRNNIEDAQYMTPPEVVDFMCELGLTEALRIGRDAKTIVVSDPSCGVGSFMAQFYRCWLQSRLKDSRSLQLVGQDKVDRMARLTKLNLLLFGARQAIITRGNSLLPGSELDEHTEQCDLILTNPPFGARFHTSELSFHSAKFFPCLHNFIQSSDAYVDSELLFLDRYLSLLRPGGVALAVVPDAVVSAAGLPALFREHLVKNCSVVSVTELPAVTFAQAGTRTKTCVLHFRKLPATKKSVVFFAGATSLGFEVASRKGVPYKRQEGENELVNVLKVFREMDNHQPIDTCVIHSKKPSCVCIPHTRLLSDTWTPSHHSAIRYSTLETLETKSSDGHVQLVKLGDIVSLPNQHTRGAKPQAGVKCISVLHVGDFGALNIRELATYSPKYPGQTCQPGDVLFSKINPRIPRAVVVPDLGCPLSCSSEFEVMRAIKPYSAYEIMLLLLSSYAQSQIQSLTSGTSSSHNRIKTEQLMSVLLPMPKHNKGMKKADFSRIVSEFKEAHTSLTEASVKMYESWKASESLLNGV